MKKILLITTIALFGLYVQPAYSVDLNIPGPTQNSESGYGTGDFNLVETGQTAAGDACDPNLEDCSSGIINGSGLTGDTGDTGGTDDTETTEDTGETTEDTGETTEDTDETPEEDTPTTTADDSGDDSGDENDEADDIVSTPFDCDTTSTDCVKLGFTVDDLEKCGGRIALPCPFDSNYYFCSKPENSAVREPEKCPEGTELVSGACQPKCPDGATRGEGGLCSCGGEKIYVLMLNKCVCTGGRIGDNCDSCLGDFELSDDGSRCELKDVTSDNGITTTVGSGSNGSSSNGSSSNGSGGGGGFNDLCTVCSTTSRLGACTDLSAAVEYESIKGACRELGLETNS